MGKVLVSLSDEAEYLARKLAFKKYNGRKGALGKVIDEAIRYYYQSYENDSCNGDVQ